MIFKGRVSLFWNAAIAVLNGISLASIIFSGFSVGMLVSILILVVVDLYLIPVLFRNEVTVTKKELIVQFGLLKKVLPIQDILVVRQMRDYSASFAADFDRVGIESKKRSTVFVSVDDPDTLISELKKLNKKIKYVI